MVQDAVTVGKESLVVKCASHAMLTEEREGSNDKRMTLSESSLVEKAEHTYRTSHKGGANLKFKNHKYQISQLRARTISALYQVSGAGLEMPAGWHHSSIPYGTRYES